VVGVDEVGLALLLQGFGDSEGRIGR
jgi:hypothetical protein